MSTLLNMTQYRSQAYYKAFALSVDTKKVNMELCIWSVKEVRSVGWRRASFLIPLIRNQVFSPYFYPYIFCFWHNNRVLVIGDLYHDIALMIFRQLQSQFSIRKEHLYAFSRSAIIEEFTSFRPRYVQLCSLYKSHYPPYSWVREFTNGSQW